MSPPLTPDADEARRQLAEELAKPAYSRPLQSWLGDLLDRLGDWFDGNIDPVNQALSLDQTVALVAVLVIAVAAIIWAVMGRLRAERRRAGGLELETEERSSAELRTTAEQFAAAGDWQQAFLTLFRAQIRSLSERVIIDEFPGMTAKEATDRAALRLPGLAGQLGWAAAMFDAIAYGHHGAVAAHYQELVSLAEQLASTRPTPLATATIEDQVVAEVVE